MAQKPIKDLIDISPNLIIFAISLYIIIPILLIKQRLSRTNHTAEIDKPSSNPAEYKDAIICHPVPY